jgi:hypothetical protein
MCLATASTLPPDCRSTGPRHDLHLRRSVSRCRPENLSGYDHLARAAQAEEHDPAVPSLRTTIRAAKRVTPNAEASASLQRFLIRHLNFLDAHLTLAAVYSELGKEAEARAEAAEVLRINPQFSLEVHKERVPLKDPAMLERHIAALRKAGLK